MITSLNRQRVTNAINQLLSAAEYFSAFAMAGGFTASEAADQVSNEMAAWASFKAREFDGQFKELAAILGYRVEKIEPVEPVIANLEAANGAVHEVFRPILAGLILPIAAE